MVGQPAGTVTLVFTDIAGSTALLTRLGEEAYREALGTHRRLVRSAFARHDGYEVDYEGDSFFYAFASAQGAVDAVRDAVGALDGGPIRIRVGIHTGEPALDPPKYVGIAVHEAARIMSAGHGGQVLISAATRTLVEAPTTDLGAHRLKDLPAPVRIHQLGSQRFPPLKTLSVTNLPTPASSFLGRQEELEAARALLATSRLLTVSGPGGAGKTRFAIELASGELERFPGGVFWVPLAALRDPGLVSDAIGRVLGATGDIVDHIGDKPMLLLLDNFEQVAAAAEEVARLLDACHGLTCLVTSRELLRVQAETEYLLPTLAASEGVALFCERTRLESSDAVAELCLRLDNLPLAIELAAARTRVLDPEALLARLGQRLDLLKGGRDADDRQRTLRATIEWSYDLLEVDERELFARLAVFRGGCTLEAAEEICSADLDVLQSLRDKSLLRFTEGRYWMLETIREFAAERLDELPDADEVRRRLTEWLCQLAHETEPALQGTGEQAKEQARLAAELENVRASLLWSRDHDTVLHLDLIVHLALFLWIDGHLAEGLGWLESAIARPADVDPALRAHGLEMTAWLAYHRGELAAARDYADASADLYRDLGDERGLGRALKEQAKCLMSAGDRQKAKARLTEALRLARRTDDAWNLSVVLNNLADLELQEGAYDDALVRAGESVELRRGRGDDWGATFSGFNVGLCLVALGRLDEAATQLRATLELSRKTGITVITAEALAALAAVEAGTGRAERAARLLGAAEAAFDEAGEGIGQFEDALRTRTVEQARAALGDGPFVAAWDEGRAADLDDAIEFALSAPSTSQPAAHPAANTALT